MQYSHIAIALTEHGWQVAVVDTVHAIAEYAKVESAKSCFQLQATAIDSHVLKLSVLSAYQQCLSYHKRDGYDNREHHREGEQAVKSHAVIPR